MSELLHLMAFAAFPLLMAYAAASDLFTMTISNRVALALIGLFVLFAPVVGFDLATLGQHAGVGAAVLAAGFFCFAMGWIGGGDAKLAAAIALWLGPQAVIEFIGISAVLGGVLTLLILSLRSAALPGAMIRLPWVARLHSAESGVPYGIALAAAALMIYPESVWLRLAVG